MNNKRQGLIGNSLLKRKHRSDRQYRLKSCGAHPSYLVIDVRLAIRNYR